MSLKSKLVKSATALAITVGTGFGLNTLFNEESDTPRIPEHCLDYQPDGELTAIRFGAEPIDLHIWGRNTHFDNFLEDSFGANAGLLGGTNHQYVEFGNINNEGEFVPLRRIHGFDGAMLSPQSAGQIVIGSYGSETIPFSQDPIYDDDPHRTHCGELQSANNNGSFLWPGNTEIIFEGQPEQVSTIYANALELVSAFNDRKYNYFPLGSEMLGPNGNSFYAVLTQQIQKQINLNDDSQEFDPWGIDFGINWQDQALEITFPEIDAAQLEQHITALEERVANQIESFTSSPQDLPTAVPHQ